MHPSILDVIARQNPYAAARLATAGRAGRNVAQNKASRAATTARRVGAAWKNKVLYRVLYGEMYKLLYSDYDEGYEKNQLQTQAMAARMGYMVDDSTGYEDGDDHTFTKQALDSSNNKYTVKVTKGTGVSEYDKAVIMFQPKGPGGHQQAWSAKFVLYRTLSFTGGVPPQIRSEYTKLWERDSGKRTVSRFRQSRAKQTTTFMPRYNR